MNSMSIPRQLSKALELFGLSADRRKEAVTLLFLDLASFNLDKYEECKEFCAAASKIFDELGDMEGKVKHWAPSAALTSESMIDEMLTHIGSRP